MKILILATSGSIDLSPPCRPVAYPLLPTTLLGRLAVDRRQQGKSYGRFLLADALCRYAQSEITSFAVIVDAKDDNACYFYERESFLPFPDQPRKLFRPMTDIRRLFN